MSIDFRPSFRRPFAYDYRLDQGSNNAPEVAVGEYLYFFEGVESPNSPACTPGLAGVYTFPSAYVDFLNGYHLAPSAAPFNDATPVEATRSANILSCQLNNFQEVYDSLRLQVSAGSNRIFVSPGILPSSGGVGTIFSGGSGGAFPGPGECLAKFNRITTISYPSANWGANGNGYLMQGPLTPQEVLDLINTTVPI